MTDPVTVSLSAMIAASRVAQFRDAVAATLRARYPDIEVGVHPGKIDIADIVAGNSFQPPCIRIAVTRVEGEGRLSQDIDLPLQVSAFVVTENRMIGALMSYGDELAYAIGVQILRDLQDEQLARWGLPDISAPDKADFKPLFTAKSYDKGTLFYVASWQQTLLFAGTPSWQARSGNWSEEP